MSTFANSLLHLLLSWMRTLFSDLLSAVQGEDAGLLLWISRRWIPLALALIVAGIAVDAFIYVLRWRPQYVWRTRLRTFLRRRRAPDPEEEQFEEGYDTALPGVNFGDMPVDGLQTVKPDPILETYYEAPAPEMEQAAAEETPPQETRRRRSDRHTRRNPVRFGTRGEKRGIPMDSRSAFREPVYPMEEPRKRYFNTQNEDSQHD